MSTVYLTEQGAVVRQSSKHLIVTKDKTRLAHVPLIKLDRLVVVGHVQLTTEAVHALLEEGVDVAFLSNTGKLRGRLVAAESKNVFLRLAQYERHLDDAFQIELARIIVKAKILNGRAVIRRYLRNHPEIDFAGELQLIEHTAESLGQLDTIDRLMGAEGSATAAYFRAFGKMFRKELTFEKRTRRPPKDPVNAVLSFGYTLLTNEIMSLLTAQGFDPYIGFFHGVVYGRPSLALDLVEEFRHPLVDRFTLFLFNNEIFTAEDFRPVEGEGIYLQPQALKTFFQQYERRMQEPLAAADEDEPKAGFREILRAQVQRLMKTIKTAEPYEPFQILE
jgi:CRISPR-associated protein Cas1